MASPENPARSVGAVRLFLEVRGALSSLSDGRVDGAGKNAAAESVLKAYSCGGPEIFHNRPLVKVLSTS
jgi:hypothetical protein